MKATTQQTKHTPGPWHIANEDTVVGPSGNVVAECTGYSVKATDPVQRTQGGREANAALIAAAPALLAALERIKEGCEVPGDAPVEHLQSYLTDIYTTANAAIEAAHGR